MCGQFGRWMARVCVFTLLGASAPVLAADAASAPGAAVPVREHAITADQPLPDAALTWRGGGGQCFHLPSGSAIRNEQQDGLTLAGSLDLLRSIGITEIYWSHTDIRNAVRGGTHPRSIKLPAELDEVLAEAARRDMTVGLFLNWNDAGLDLLSRDYRQTMHNLLDALAEKKKTFPNLTATWWDEIWCAMSRNAYAEHLDSFRDFCCAEYGEAYEADKMPPAADPADKWWRRYLVFKYCIYEDFSRDLADYGRARGLVSIPFLVNQFAYRRSHGWGHDRYRLSKIGDYNLAATYYKNPMPVENSIMHLQTEFGGYVFSQVFRGVPVEHWTFSSLLNNPELIAKCREVYSLAQAWRGARPAEEVAVLIHPPALLGQFMNAEAVHADTEELLQQTLTSYFATRMLDVRDTRLYKLYKVLLLPRYAGYSVPEFVVADLLEFVRQGGVLVVLDAEIAVGRRDLTDPRPCTEEVTGLRLASDRALAGAARFADMADMQLPLASVTQAAEAQPVDDSVTPVVFAGEMPVGFERVIGQGRVLSLYLDMARQVKADPARWGYVLAKLISARHQPAVTAEGNISVQGVIRHGDRLMISLYTAAGPAVDISTEPTQVPEVAPAREEASGIVRIRPAALGLSRARHQVFGLSDYTARSNAQGAVWSNAQLEQGVPVSITAAQGFENLVIEEPGVEHAPVFVNEMARTDQETKAAFQYARENPPIAYHPFAARVKLAPGRPALAAPWHDADAPCRMFFGWHAQAAVSGEVVVLNCRDLVELAGVDIAAGMSVRLYQLADGDWRPIACQTLPGEIGAELTAGHPAAARAPAPELVFVTDVHAGENLFCLYLAGANASADTAGGLARAIAAGGQELDNGISRVVMAGNGYITITAVGQEKPSWHITDFGVRFLKLWNTAQPVEILADGPVMAVARRQVTGAFRNIPNVTMSATVRMYRGSPCIELTLAARNLEGKYQHVRWPAGTIYPSANWQEQRKACRIFTARGWQPPGFASMPLADDCRTIVTFDTPPTARGFGLLIAASTFAAPPRWLIETPGLFWLQPTLHHGGFAQVEDPLVHYLFLQGMVQPEPLAQYADHLRAPLQVTCSPMESRP